MNHIKPPRLGLRIGVVGNRDLSDVDTDAIRQHLDTLLSQLCQTVENIWQKHNLQSKVSLYSDEPPQYYLIDSLAEGADQLAANVVKDLSSQFKLCCPIPFPIDTYKKYFADDGSRDQFDTLISDASLESTVIELDCSDTSAQYRQHGYRAAADMLLENSDILIALYDPDKEDEMGGSLDTAIIARQRRIPVIHINTKRPDEITYCKKINRLEEKSISVNEQVIDDLLLSLLIPASSKLDNEHSKKHSDCIDDVKRFYNEPLLRNFDLMFLLTKLLYFFYTPVWKALYATLKVFQPIQKLTIPCADVREKDDSIVKSHKDLMLTIKEPYQQQKEKIDTLANDYMEMYRGSFILNFLLGAVAVLLAVLSYIMEDSENIAQVFTVAEFICLTIIFVTYVMSRVGKWQKKAIDYRFMAEYFRHIEILALLGRNIPMLQPSPHYHTHDPANTWMGWYINALTRSIGPFGSLSDKPSKQRIIQLNREYVATVQQSMCREWLEEQYVYHMSSFKRYSRWKKLSNRIMGLLFLLTVSGVVMHFTHTHQYSTSNEEVWKAIIALLVTVLPAFLAAIHGVTVQGEFERLAERSSATAAHLQTMIIQFNAVKPETQSQYADMVGDHAVEAAQIMLEEVMDWQILYRGHSVELT